MSIKAIDMHCILFIIRSFQYQRPQQERSRHQHWKDRLVSQLLIRIVCWASVTYFQFHSQQFACRIAEEIVSYSSAVTLVALALSYLTVTCHIAYKTLSHIYYLNILGVKLAYMVSITRCIFTLVQFRLVCGPDHLLKWFERSDLYPSRKLFRGHLHLVFSGSDSYPIRKQCMKWPGVNSPFMTGAPKGCWSHT